MNELSHKHQQYVFDQDQVEACADEFHKRIQAGLKAEVAAGHFIYLGLIPKNGVMVEYPFTVVKSPSRQTPYVLVPDGVNNVRRTSIAICKDKEIGAVVKALKRRCSKDGINIYKMSRGSDGDYTTYIRATFVLG